MTDRRRPTGRRARTLFKGAATALSAAVLVLASPALAHAAPPPALPGNAGEAELRFQPAFDYDRDGCYASPAIGPDGTIAPGLKIGGDVNGNCRDLSDLENSNSYSREKCNNGWCAYMYALYFEKDQVSLGGGSAGHRHDWEHVVVWVRGDQVEYVSTSAHGGFAVHPRSEVLFEGSHPKVVYHKDGGSTHCFRTAAAHDDPPENHRGTWQYPTLVGWNGYPGGLRDKLAAADFGSALLGIKDGQFNGHLARAKPSGIPFDPEG
ncbi:MULTISPECIES: NPP1 family protein [unclassified Streptomyces]|uniref:NPP1 family protein n=1 Tax=unclassified Streptomyces TaxID=2593676 RepID=UPI002DD8C184|nr:NPP1 family protein [Streptomyces sp. NBC_01237]WRZ75739.1 NPP1 family protein [Streptomyces sp. NBC_01237]